MREQNSSHHSHSKHSNFSRARSEHISQYKISHSVGVAEYMRERAEDYGLDGNIAYTTGLLHDIGYLEGRLGHEQIGGEILTAMKMPDWIVYCISNHANELAKLPKEEISPMLVLLVEADLSIEVHGYRVGFEKRVEDIASRYGTESPAFDAVKSNVNFIKEYQKEHNIPSQEEVVNRKTTGKGNHGSGKFIGSETKAELLKKKEEKEKEINEPDETEEIDFFDLMK